VYIGSALIGDAGVRAYVGACQLASATTMHFVHTETGNVGYVNNGAPMTWGTSDVVHWTITYESAS
jgi:hypothetical protein